ncbi:MAG TPA: MarR family transcriptional regulator [Gemmatimonadaceae bacterium]
MDERTERFIERMGQFFEAEAGPRIAGRLFGLLLLLPGALSLDEIAERLQVSKASVSANARMLEQLNVIGRLTKPGDRRDYYAVTEDTQRRLIELRLQRLVALQELFGEALTTASAQEDESVRERLRLFQDSFEMMTETVRRIRDGIPVAVPGADREAI